MLRANGKGERIKAVVMIKLKVCFHLLRLGAHPTSNYYEWAARILMRVVAFGTMINEVRAKRERSGHLGIRH